MLRKRFPEITLQAEDLLLLESFQINYLPDRVVRTEFAALLRQYPVVQRFLLNKYPPIASFISQVLEENPQGSNQKNIEEQCQEALWEIADLIIYNKHPDLFDSMGKIRWDIKEIRAIASLEGKTVADVGAGSGRIAFLVAPYAQTVFAVEPAASFRSFMREKGIKQDVKNLFVMDGTLDSIPLPEDSLDVLITSNAIGWDLNRELQEIERVLKPGGTSIHLIYSDAKQEDSYHETLISSSWNYHYTRTKLEKTIKTIYYKRITDKIIP